MSAVRPRAARWRVALALLVAGSALAGPPCPPRPGVLAFISDTLAPLFFEELRLRPEHNGEATAALFADILRERPQHVFLLGDLVSLGFYGRSWEAVDAFRDTLAACGIPSDAVVGNHELMLFPAEGEANFLRRFPADSPGGYIRTEDSVAVVLLNSNFGRLGTEGAWQEERWYARTLDSLDGDPQTVAVIVCCHHAPYSNSTVTGPSLPVQQRFVPPFAAARKTRLFLSGHAHTAEHFREGGKDFLVIGGGGGLSHPLEPGRWHDLTADPRPHFHYLLVRRDGNALVATIRALGADMRTLGDVPVPLAPVGGSERSR